MPAANPAAFDFLQNRRSRPAKLFSGPVPSRDQVRVILSAATRVPDHGKLEPWRLVVVQADGMARLATLADAHAQAIGAEAEKTAKARGQFDLGQVAVVVISAPKASDKVPAIEQVLSAGALCMNIVTCAEAAGWGANWLTGWPSHDPAFVALAFGCSSAETVAGIIHMGTPAPDGPDRPRPDLDRLITWGCA